MYALRNALVLALALTGVIWLLRAELRETAREPVPSQTRADLERADAAAAAPAPPSTMELARLEPLPNGDLIGVFTIHAGAALEIPVFPGIPGDAPWLAYTDLLRRAKDGGWEPPMRGCCARGVLTRRVAAGASLEARSEFKGPYHYDTQVHRGSARRLSAEDTNVRLSAKGAPDSAPFTLDFDACARDGCFDRAYDEANAALVASLRARGFTGPIVDAPDPAVALAEALYELAFARERCRTDAPRLVAARGLRYFQLTGDVLFESGWIVAKGCTDFMRVAINLEPHPSPKFESLGRAAHAPASQAFLDGRPLEPGDELHALLYGEERSPEKATTAGE